jgi:hypothetical protein
MEPVVPPQHSRGARTPREVAFSGGPRQSGRLSASRSPARTLKLPFLSNPVKSGALRIRPYPPTRPRRTKRADLTWLLEGSPREFGRPMGVPHFPARRLGTLRTLRPGVKSCGSRRVDQGPRSVHYPGPLTHRGTPTTSITQPGPA